MDDRSRTWLVSIAMALCAAGVQAQERSMNVRQAPDTVFVQPVGTLMPELAGATATGENGRVGGELVFWGYRLGDGRPVYMFACAMLQDVNCEQRIQMICVDHTNVLRTESAGGNIVRRECRSVALLAPGNTSRGCIDTPENAPLTIGLVSCGGA